METVVPSLPEKRHREEEEEGSDESTVDKKNNKKSKTCKESPLVVFAHGAGSPSTSEWMIRWKEMLGDALDAVDVVTFDYPYISLGKRKAPPKAEKLVEHHGIIVKDAINKYPGHPVILAGKSMGSRVSCMVSLLDDFDISCIICLGYPLKGMNGAIRDETLLELRTPTMFVQGSKDNLCPLDKLSATREKMKCANELYIIEGGDHSFKIGKKFLESTGSTQHQAERTAVKAIADFLMKSVGGSLRGK